MACNVEEVLKEVQDRLDNSKKGSEEYDQLLAVKSQLGMIKAVSSGVENLEKNKLQVEVLTKAEKTLPKDYYNALNKIVKKVLGPKVTSSKTIAFAKFTLDTYGVIGGQYADGRVTLSKRPNQEALEAEAKGNREVIGYWLGFVGFLGG